jgi:hypothetical protein
MGTRRRAANYSDLNGEIGEEAVDGLACVGAGMCPGTD